jgi:hypothetical protein
MSYKPIHAWKRKDQLPSKDPQKIIYGTQLQDEFDAIAEGVGSLEEHVDQIQGEIDKLPEMVEEAPEDGVIYGRANKTWVPVQAGGGSPGGNLVFWDAILDKPEGIATLGYQNTIDGGTYGGRFK